MAMALIAVLATASCLAPYPMRRDTTKPPAAPPPVALSPDGRTVAFSAKRRIGLYDWRTGAVRYIQAPAEFAYLAWPSFSTNGRELAVIGHIPLKNANRLVTETRLGVVDLATGKMTAFQPVMPGSSIFNALPVFRPDGKAILYQEETIGSHVRAPYLIDLATGTSRSFLSGGDGFGGIETPSFIGNDTIFFLGRNPSNPELKAAALQLAKDAIAAGRETSDGFFIPYTLRMGSKPEVAHLDFVKHQLSVRYLHVPTAMPASRNAERIIFATHNPNVSTSRPEQLFVMENGKVRQVTHLGKFVTSPTISHDGSTAAFSINAPTSPLDSSLELAIVDLNTGQVTQTDFVKRIYAPAVD